MKTDDLIGQLSTDLKSVKPQWSAVQFSCSFLFLCALFIGLGLALVHVRSDWRGMIATIPFLVDLLSSLGLMASAVLAVAYLSSPGLVKGNSLVFAAMAFVLVILAFSVLRTSLMDSASFWGGLDVFGSKCFLTVLCFAFIPSLLLSLATRRRAAMRPKIVGIAIFMASVGAGTLAITLHCNVDNAAHIALWHFVLPILVGVVAGLGVGAKFLKW